MQAQSNPYSDTLAYCIAILIAVLFTIIIGIIEAQHKCKPSLKACFNLPFAIYLIVYSIGNTIGTLLAVPLIGAGLPFPPFFYAIAGVFAFRGVISNSTISILNKGISLEPLLEKAWHAAEYSINKTQLSLDSSRIQERIDRLCDLEEERLTNCLLAQPEGADLLSRHEKVQQKTPDLSSHLYKAITLANEFSDAAEALLKSADSAKSSESG